MGSRQNLTIVWAKVPDEKKTGRKRDIMPRSQTVEITAVLLVTLAGVAAAQARKEYRFTVGPNSVVSIINQYGAVQVKPTTSNLVTVSATIYSDKVEVDQNQSGNRVEVESHLLAGARPENARVDYDVLVPPDADVTMRSTTGPLRAERLQGDLDLEGTTAVVDVRDISNAHLRIKTLNGPVTLTNVHDGVVNVESVSGEVRLVSVTGRLVRVTSTSGPIRYEGDFGYTGNYQLSSHSGDIEAIIPQDTSAEVQMQSVRGHLQDDVHLAPKVHTTLTQRAGSSFVGTINKAASLVSLKTFSGKIHLKKR
jgi:DUF4097 and DUF4098 domain-containing protein YvlB